jgi:hypothetical protein
MPRPLAAWVACGAGALAAAAPAVAQAPVTASLAPDTPRAGATLVLDASAQALGVPAGAPPRALRVLVQPGFAFDPRAVPARCAPAARTCPRAARILTGTAEASYTYLGFSGDATARIRGYLAPPRRPGDLAGIVVRGEVPALGRRFASAGRVLRAPAPDGLELRFEDLLGGNTVPGGTQIALRRLQLTAGARRTVVTRRRVRRGSKRVSIRVRSRRSLLRNPPACAGAWTGRVVLTLADGSERTVPVTLPCRAGK